MRRITNRRQRNKRMLMSMMIIILSILFFAINSYNPIAIEAHEPIQVIKVRVEKGDSLWKIADRYDNNKMDLRHYIYLIEKYNNLDNSILQPGSVLNIPIY